MSLTCFTTRFSIATCFSPCLICLLLPLVTVAQSPPKDGLVLWLDATDGSSLETDSKNRISKWNDKSGKQNHAAAIKEMPIILSGEHPFVRFTPNDKPSPLVMPALRSDTGNLTMFVVARRTAKQGTEAKWQRILSAAEDGKKDNEGNGLAFTLTPGGGAQSFDACIYSSTKATVASLPVTLGTTTASQPGGGLLADVGELLVYNHAFDDPTEFEAVQDYLAEKWNVTAARDVSGWVRHTELPPKPDHDNRQFPLFDQANDGNWQAVDAMTDEFDGEVLDDTKWWDHNPTWYGRVPARYMPENLEISSGELLMTTRKDTTLPRERLHLDIDDDYENYSAASINSKQAITYGCFETRIKVAKATCTSSWWFVGKSRKAKETGSAQPPSEVVNVDDANAKPEDYVERMTELDVFELASGAEGHSHRFGMNMHIFKEPETDHHWSNWGNWEAPFIWYEDYHTINFVWSPDWIRYYVDGHCVRTTRNVAWHTPMKMIYDMEIMSWLPFPEDSEFPAVYHVDYVRTWTRADWVAEPGWVPIPDPGKETGVTKRVREFSEQRKLESEGK